MAKPKSRAQRKSAKDSRNRALNAFDTAVDDSYYIKGLRQQQDIDLEHVADDRIRQLLSNQVNSEDDEDIDSDEAMGSASDISLGEHDEDEDAWGESLDEAELLPLSEVWDLNDDSDGKGGENEPETAKHTAQTQKQKPQPPRAAADRLGDVDSAHDSDADSESEEVDSDDDGGSDDISSEEGSSDDAGGSDAEEDSIGLSDSGRSSSDRFSEDEEDTAALRRAIKSVSEANERDFSSTKLVEAGAENPFALPRTSLADSLNLEDLVPSTSKAKTLSVPAPQRIQERANREAAFELAKEEVEKWADTVATNRRAEHLQFPINAAPQLQSASPFAGTAPSERNGLEEKVAEILRTSQLEDEKQASTFEETAPSALSVEDLRKRRDQLRYMRDLMFHEERRARRIKKIKSKTYRKIHKKERERMAELENSDDEDGEGNLADAERQRALERATLRHKSNSKWAKRMLEQGLSRDAGTRGDIEEMLRQSDALRQKIRGHNEESESEDDASDDFGGSAEHGNGGGGEAVSNKGVLGMKFMQEAAQREREANERLMNDDYDDNDSDGDTNIERKTYNPAGQQLKRDLEAREAESEEDDRRDSSEKKKARQKSIERTERGDETLEFRPVDDQPMPPHQKQRQRAARSNTASAASKPDSSSASLELASSENPWLKATENSSVPGMVKLATGKKNGEQPAGSKNPRSTKITVENTFGDTLVREQDMSFDQQDLVRQAFAGDDVVSEFDAEKRAEIEQDQDQEIDETLPGWGSWSNEAPRIQKIRKIAGINEKQRRDYKKKDVLINEKLNKKAAKYNASAVPFPFENRQQYERSLRMPIGQEWVTKDTFQRQTKPRVIVKRSTVIDPIKKPKFN